MERQGKIMRARMENFETREAEDGLLHISGYFAVYGPVYEIAPGMSESIAPGAFAGSIDGDVRALVNHDTTLVLGRTTAGTLELRDEEAGLWGDILINPNDQDALSCYERVKRRDVDQCSIGFEIISEETDFREDGSVHWTIREAKLWEVSVCTFPAYEDTSISARAAQRDDLLKRKAEAWREKMLKKLKGEHDGN